MKEAYWILDAGFQMWFLSTTFLNFSFHHSSSSDRCDTNWFFYFAFISLTTSPSPHLSSLLLTFSLFSISMLIFCVFHWFFLSFVVYTATEVTEIDYSFLSFSYFSLSVVAHLCFCLSFNSVVHLFAFIESIFFTKWRRKGRVQIELQDR